MNFTRSTDLKCDPRNYSVCSNGTQTSASVSPLTDSVATLQKPTAYWLQYGSKVTDPIVLPEQKFEPQRNFGSTAFNGRHWLVTGNFAGPNQVWSSADGSNWKLENAGASFPARNYFKLLTFKNALLVIGGESFSTGAVLNDVWTSSDGRTWIQATSNDVPHESFCRTGSEAPWISRRCSANYLPMTSGVLRTAQPGQPQRLPRHGGVGSLLSLCRLTGACGFWEDSGAACMQISGLQRTVSAGYRRPHKLNLAHAFLIASLRMGKSCG